MRSPKTFSARMFDMIFLRIARVAQSGHGSMTSLERELAGQIIARIGLDTTFQPLVEEGRARRHHQVGSLKPRPTLAELVLS